MVTRPSKTITLDPVTGVETVKHATISSVSFHFSSSFIDCFSWC